MKSLNSGFTYVFENTTEDFHARIARTFVSWFPSVFSRAPGISRESAVGGTGMATASERSPFPIPLVSLTDRV